jgi:COG4 transport protein
MPRSLSILCECVRQLLRKVRLYCSCCEFVDVSLTFVPLIASSPLYYITALTALFESIALIVDQHQPVVEKYYGPGKMSNVIARLVQECDRVVKSLLDAFEEERSMKRKVGLYDKGKDVCNDQSDFSSFRIQLRRDYMLCSRQLVGKSHLMVSTKICWTRGKSTRCCQKLRQCQAGGIFFESSCSIDYQYVSFNVDLRYCDVLHIYRTILRMKRMRMA